ncbi:MAG TPA: acyltransferase family protein [Candidatus Limnocylindrales bacterium]|nr:acyltransferase family protein [Candidatus Limnocylindrales bacterium]
MTRAPGPAAAPPAPGPAAAATDGRADAFRPDLEGLRGVAILLVLAFHAGAPAPGGFIGVDVFFVLSGFLITGLLLREHERDGRIDLVRFYARRARRILPAALVVIVGTLVASALVLAPIDLPGIAGDAAATALWAGNIRFAIDATDYFGAVAPSPLLHYWSLGVEEQFYLVWPALMIAATAVARPVVGARFVIGAIVGVSLLAAIVLTDLSGPWAFYSLPSRAWQLGLGGLLAATVAGQARLPGWLAAGLGWAGLAAIVGSAFAIDAAVPYPGTAALVPTAGAAAVILSGPRRWSPGQLLAVAPMRFLGRISFSLYLVHWPMFVLPAATLALDEELPPEVRAGLALVSVVVATALHLVVEQPFHRGRRIMAIPARRTLAGAGAGVAAVAIASLVVGTVAAGLLPGGPGGVGGLPGTSPPSATATPVATEPLPTEHPSTRPTTGAPTPEPTPTPAPPTPAPVPTGPTALTPDVRPALATVRTDVERIQADGCNLLYSGIEPPDCVYGDPDAEIAIALVGDSHAAQWFPAVEQIALEQGWKLVPFTKVSCRFVDLPVYSRELSREYTECTAWRQRVIERLVELRPAITIVASARGMAVVDPADDDPSRQGEAMARLLAPVPGEIVVLADTPQSIYDVPACISRNLADVTRCETPIGKAFNWRRLRLERAAAEASGGTLVDLTDWICPADRCPVLMNGLLVYRDVHHMTATFAASLAGPLYRALPELP